MKILHLITSSRGKASNSLQLGNAIVEKLQAAHPGSTVVTHDLTATPYAHLEEVNVQSYFTPQEERTPELIAAIKNSDAAIAELMAADVIVIGVPMYNFSIPSTLKTWIDHVARRGVTFSYSEKGAEGLVKGKKVYLAISSGAIYSEGPMKSYDFTESYLRAVLGFMGMTDITAIRAEGMSIPHVKEHAMDKAIASIAV
jgi:FMN-dependent NADH-azoreductase